jgi:hypothetical protein
MNRKRVVVCAVMLALLAGLATVAGIQLAGEATERLSNGGFESGFYTTPVGLVGNGWHWFHNRGGPQYSFYDETWTPVVFEGKHSQMIEVNTYGRGASDPDRYAGIYQTVAVAPGESYELFLSGMLRAREDDPDLEGYNYRVQYGVDYAGGTDWQAVGDWYELPWDTVYPRLAPGVMDTYTTTLTATSNRLTLFIRTWKKWGTAGRELDVNLDAISLKGAMPAEQGELTVSFMPPSFPVVGWSHVIVVEGSSDVGITHIELYDGDTLVGDAGYEVGLLELSHEFQWKPATDGSHTLKAVAHDAGGSTATHKATVTVGKAGQFLTNGGFEEGFDAIPVGKVGKGWGWFYNDGRAGYGFYDETWMAAIHAGEHSQMIEINTLAEAASDADRYAGIYQTVDGLTAGATYKLSMNGLMRVLSDDLDRQDYSYLVQWGYDPGGGVDWQAVENWVELPWNELYTRLAPGIMSSYTTTFEAPASKITIFIRVWKKWGTTSRELDVNLDTITLEGYH